jgi:aminomethyltransferase
MSTLKRTPLFAAHQKLGARLVEFGGWEMPVQYSSIIDEHLAVRKAGGIFDISHMGEVRFTGPGAAAFLNFLLTNDINKLAVGQGQYTLMCNERGGVVDDLYAYRLGTEEFLLVINASRIDPDVTWMQQQLSKWPGRADLRLKNESDQLSAVAIQGPRTPDVVDASVPGAATGGASVNRPSELKKNSVAIFDWKGKPIYVGRTGYTGEDGFEIIAPNELIEDVWMTVLAKGHAHCIQPAGLGARDTLRTEVCYPLYGHELDESTTPLEAGIGFFVSFEKGDFIGRSVLADQKKNGVQKKSVAFKMSDKSAPPRPHYPIWSVGPGSEKIGEVVSGTLSPSLNIGIGLGYVPTRFAAVGTPLEIEVRGRRFAASVVQKPILRKS